MHKPSDARFLASLDDVTRSFGCDGFVCSALRLRQRRERDKMHDGVRALEIERFGSCYVTLAPFDRTIDLCRCLLGVARDSDDIVTSFYEFVREM